MTMYYWNNFIEDIRSQLKPGYVLFDAGAGDGHWKSYFPSVKYIAMDLGIGDSEGDYSQLDIKGDLRNIPLQDNSVDIIISIQVLEHLSEPWKVIAEFQRVLKPQGLLFISCPQSEEQHQVPYDFFRYTPFGIKSLLNSSGFEVVWIKSQLGNFSKIINDVCYSAKKLPSLSENWLLKPILLFTSFYLRQVMWRLHQPLFRYLDQFEQFQYHSVGHFLKANKV
ncbi:class I SAM-dependent methyltransferase [Nostoc sp.]